MKSQKRALAQGVYRIFQKLVQNIENDSIIYELDRFISQRDLLKMDGVDEWSQR